MVTLVDRVKVTTATVGTGSVDTGSAVDGFKGFAQSGLSNGASVRYVIEDGDAYEIGTGTYNSLTGKMSRSLIESSTGSLLSLSGNAIVYLSVSAGDIQYAADMDQGVATTDSPSFAGGSFYGNVTVTGTVDGRDVSVDGAKLDGIEAGATADQTASEILTAIKTVDGPSSGLNADLLDGQHGSYYYAASNPDGFTDNDGTVTSVSSGSGLTGGPITTSGTISHADTSTQSSVNNSGGTVIQDVTLDGFGHVTALGSKTLTASDVGAAATSHTHAISDVTDLQTTLDAKVPSTRTITAGSGLTGGGDLSANRTLSVDTAALSNTFLPLTGGTLTGNIELSTDREVRFNGTALRLYSLVNGSSYIVNDANSLLTYSDNVSIRSRSGENMITGTANSSVSLYHDNSAKLTTTSSGVTTTGDAWITGNARIDGGIYLGGVGSANYLDDYEIGTWTPTLTSGSTSSANGHYVKVGDFVTVWVYLSSFSDTTSSSYIVINNLPFRTAYSSNSPSYTGSSMLHTFPYDSVCPYVSQGSLNVYFFANRANTSYGILTHQQLSSSSSIYFTLSYRSV